MKINKNGAYTMIELLIVIGIMAVFSAVIYSSFGSSKAKSRDQERISDVSTIQIALEQYFSKKGIYPVNLNDPSFIGTYLSADLANKYVNNYFPMTKNSGTNYCITYQLWTKFELSNQYQDSKKNFDSTASTLAGGLYECGDSGTHPNAKIKASADSLVYDVMP